MTGVDVTVDGGFTIRGGIAAVVTVDGGFTTRWGSITVVVTVDGGSRREEVLLWL
jgi:hypothetical protein